MVSLADFRAGQEYCCQRPLNLYKSPACDSLVTQAAAGRQLRLLDGAPLAENQPFPVCLCEDDYPGWLDSGALAHLAVAPQPYRPSNLSAATIQARIPAVLHFAHQAMAQPNCYLWGGTLGPDYDCSGLVQAAFASVGVMLPRDSYQQAEFVTTIALADLQPGDLIFFGPGDRITHVALHLGEGRYIHSSGKDQGRNGIGIDSLTDLQDPVSRTYHGQLHSVGRVTQSYQATGTPFSTR